jgi:CheY-like chemotaxis protein
MILVLDDHRYIVRMLETILSRESSWVLPRENGLQLTLFGRHAADLVLMLVDIEMPAMTGPQFYPAYGRSAREYR